MDSLLLLSLDFMQWHQSGLEEVHWIHWFFLDLTGEVTDATCAPQLQLHLKNINQSKALNLQWVPQKDIQDQAVEPIIAADLWAPADIKRKAQVQNLSDPSLRDSSFYTLSGPLCRAQVLRMIEQKKQTVPRQFWKTISDYWSPGSDELEPLQKLSQVLSCLT